VFGRQVAAELRQHSYDVIHIQHCSQYVPAIRALNPTAKIILQLHAEWFSQNNRSALERRLRDVDFITTASDYITQRVRRQFPAFAERCATLYDGIDASEFHHEKNYGVSNARREKRIVYSGAVSPHKGIHVLLDAFKHVVKHHPEVRLEIIGFQGSYGLEETFDMSDRQVIGTVARFYAKNRWSRLRAKLSLGPRDAGTYQAYLKSQLSRTLLTKYRFSGSFPAPSCSNAIMTPTFLLFRRFGMRASAFPRWRRWRPAHRLSQACPVPL